MKTNYGLVIILSFLLLFAWIGESNVLGNTPPSNFSLELESIRFNHNFEIDPDFPWEYHNKIDALDIRINLDNEVRSKEWDMQYPDDPHPAVYVKQSQDDIIKNIKVSIIATFKVKSADIEQGTTILIRADNEKDPKDDKDFGKISPREITFDKVVPIDECFSIEFCILPQNKDKITAFTQEWTWYWQLSGGVEKKIRTSKNRIYIILNDSVSSPWEEHGTNQRWAEALEIACCWADGAKDQVAATAMLTQNLYDNSGGISSRQPQYSRARNNNFCLSKFIAALGKKKNGKCIIKGDLNSVNCHDMVKALVTFANVLGCETEYKEINRCKKTKNVKEIGKAFPYTAKFQRHAIAVIEKQVFDPTIKGCAHSSCEKEGYEHIKGGEWTEDQYKMWIFGEDRKKVIITNPIQFKIGIINQKSSCAFEKFLSEAKNKYNFNKWYKDTGEYRFLNENGKKLNPQVLSEKIYSQWEGAFDKSANFIPNTKRLQYKERVLDSNKGYYYEYDICKGLLKRTIVNEQEKDYCSIEIVVGQTMTEVKTYLLSLYADWVDWPSDKADLEGIGHIGFFLEEQDIVENKENIKKNKSTLHFDFIRDNILVMIQAKGFTKNELMEKVNALDNFIDEKIDSGKTPHKAVPTLPIHNKFRKNRRVIVQSWNPLTKDAIFSKKTNDHYIPLLKGYNIRIFPGFVDACTPVGYYVNFPKTWKYDHATKPSKLPDTNDSKDNSSNDCRLIFHAPEGFPVPPHPTQEDRDDDSQTLYIWGDPPIWWVEIIPPTAKEALAAFIINPGNVKVGEDDQDD